MRKLNSEQSKESQGNVCQRNLRKTSLLPIPLTIIPLTNSHA